MHVGFQRRTVLDSCKGIVPGKSPGIRVCSERAKLVEHRLLLRREGVVVVMLFPYRATSSLALAPTP